MILNVRRGGSRIFFRRGCTRLLLYFNTNKPHRFFSQNTSCIRKPQVISGGVRTPCTLPLDPSLVRCRERSSFDYPETRSRVIFFSQSEQSHDQSKLDANLKHT